MMRNPSRCWWTIVTTGAIACHKGAGQPELMVGNVGVVVVPAAGREGTYQFEIPLDRAPLRGTMTVTSDSVLLDPERDSCRPATGIADIRFIKYRCVGPDYEVLTVSLDRRSPTAFSTWWVTTTVTRQRRVCGQYGYDDKGRQICLRYDTANVEDTTSRGGTLHVNRDRVP